MILAAPDGQRRGAEKQRLALEVVWLAATLRIGYKLLSSWLNHRQYDGLEGVVSYSSRIIAAWRCLESEEPNPLFSDPLSRILAGRKAMERAEKRAQEAMIPEAACGSRSQRRLRKVNRVAIRTVWFDRQLLAALQADSHPQPLAAALKLESGRIRLGLTTRPAPKQVVLLGAGMDTRAWRLHLPEGIRWFEVDRLDVLSAKMTSMARAGATFSRHNANAQAAYPLRAASYSALEADLGEAGWTRALEAKGWDRNEPTVWLAEGLLMYLQPAAVMTLLKEIARASARGSVMLAMSVTEAVIKNAKAAGKGSELLKFFVFGCPLDPTQMLKSAGWTMQAADTRQDMVKMFGIPKEHTMDYSRATKGQTSLFIMATPL